MYDRVRSLDPVLQMLAQEGSSCNATGPTSGWPYQPTISPAPRPSPPSTASPAATSDSSTSSSLRSPAPLETNDLRTITKEVVDTARESLVIGTL